MKHVIKVYGDSWFEIEPFINSMKKNSKMISIKKDKDKLLYSYIFKYEGKIINIIFYGSYKNDLPKCIQNMFKDFSHPDLVFLQENKIIMGIEDTETSTVGNSQWQRMERLNYFVKNKIDFYYYSYSKTTDRSGCKINERYPSALQYILFKKLREGTKKNFYSIYRGDQKNIKDKFHDAASKNLLNILFKKNLKSNEIKTSEFFVNEKIGEKTRLEKDFPINNLDNFYENKKFIWQSSAFKYSKIIKELTEKKQAFTFNSGLQKVGWTLSSNINHILKKRNINPITKKYALINPVMGYQIKGKKIIHKPDPATGEFYAFTNIFKNKEVDNVVVIYSPNASPELFNNKNSKLIEAINQNADRVFLDNGRFFQEISMKNNFYSYNRIDSFSEDDVLKVVDDYFQNKNYERIYISPPSASWSKIKIKGLNFIEKKQKRPDYIYLSKKQKEIIIGEAKDNISKLRADREKHKMTFIALKNKIKMFFNDYKITEINSATGKYIREKDDFNYIKVNTKGAIDEIFRKQE